jgi:hypothetical protein
MAVPDGECCSRDPNLSGAEDDCCLLAQNDWRFKNHVSRVNVYKAFDLITPSTSALDRQREY